MIASGPGGALPSLRPAAEVQGQASPTRAAPPTVSGAPGELRPAVGAETARAVDPARQAAATGALPREETSDRANMRRGLVEPARYSPSMLAVAPPTEATLAGPPPTFDLSILEKTRAVARAAPPVIQPPSESGGVGEPVDREAETASAGTRGPGETAPDAPGGRSEPRTDAARPAAGEDARQAEPPAEEASAKLTGGEGRPVAARRDPEPAG